MTYGKSFSALGDPTRRRIFELLRDGPLSVAEIASQMPVSRPAVSQHLKVLKEADLVRDRSSGTRRIYTLHPEGVEALRHYVDSLWSDALESFRSFVADQEEPE